MLALLCSSLSRALAAPLLATVAALAAAPNLLPLLEGDEVFLVGVVDAEAEAELVPAT